MSGDHNMYASGSGDGQRSGWRKREIMEMAREAGISSAVGKHIALDSDLERFAELVREDEAEKYKWDVHSCGPTCTKVACVAMREAVQAEREACAKVVEASPSYDWHKFACEAAAAIRARGDKHEHFY